MRCEFKLNERSKCNSTSSEYDEDLEQYLCKKHRRIMLKK